MMQVSVDDDEVGDRAESQSQDYSPHTSSVNVPIGGGGEGAEVEVAEVREVLTEWKFKPSTIESLISCGCTSVDLLKQFNRVECLQLLPSDISLFERSALLSRVIAWNSIIKQLEGLTPASSTTHITGPSKFFGESDGDSAVYLGTDSDSFSEVASEENQPSSSKRPAVKKRQPSTPRQTAEQLKAALLSNGDFQLLQELGVDQHTCQRLCWVACAEARLDYLREVGFEDYSGVVPHVLLPINGPRLIEDDFKYIQPNIPTDALRRGLTKYSKAILYEAAELCSKLKGSARLPIQHILDISRTTSESVRLKSCLLLLPLLVPKGALSPLGTRISCTTCASSFVLRAADCASAKESLTQRRDAVLSPRASEPTSKSGRGRESKVKQTQTQPLILALGGNIADWSTVEEYIVYINSPLYSVNTLIEAVDLCFKCIYVFDLKYSPECENVWQVLQLLFYKIPIEHRLLCNARGLINKLEDRLKGQQEADDSS